MKHALFTNLVTLQTAPGAASEQLDPLQLIADASLIVQLVMALLFGMGIGCLFIMGAKALRLTQATTSSRKFLDVFWGSADGPAWSSERLEELYAQIGSYAMSPVAAIFRAGYVELARIGGAEHAAPGMGGNAGELDNVERALRRTASNELTALETLLPFLATTASTAPFIGLFGTVWGIMNSFIAISGQKSASLDVVAPGIAEALIATAIGLAAAIPAVMAYNYFVRRIQVLESEMEAFRNDYLNIVRRHFLTS